MLPLQPGYGRNQAGNVLRTIRHKAKHLIDYTRGFDISDYALVFITLMIIIALTVLAFDSGTGSYLGRTKNATESSDFRQDSGEIITHSLTSKVLENKTTTNRDYSLLAPLEGIGNTWYASGKLPVLSVPSSESGSAARKQFFNFAE